MDLNELKFLAAASILAGSVKPPSADRSGWTTPNDKMIKLAVEAAQSIWDEVLRQDREG